MQWRGIKQGIKFGEESKGTIFEDKPPVSWSSFILPVAGRSIWISTTSPSMISVSSLILIPMDFRNALVNIVIGN